MKYILLLIFILTIGCFDTTIYYTLLRKGNYKKIVYNGKRTQIYFDDDSIYSFKGSVDICGKYIYIYDRRSTGLIFYETKIVICSNMFLNKGGK